MIVVWRSYHFRSLYHRSWRRICTPLRCSFFCNTFPNVIALYSKQGSLFNMEPANTSQPYLLCIPTRLINFLQRSDFSAICSARGEDSPPRIFIFVCAMRSLWRALTSITRHLSARFYLAVSSIGLIIASPNPVSRITYGFYDLLALI